MPLTAFFVETFCLKVDISRIFTFFSTHLSPAQLIPQFVHQLFMEVDQDGSGTIDKGEFRQMLRKLNLTYRCALFIVAVSLFVF